MKGEHEIGVESKKKRAKFVFGQQESTLPHILFTKSMCWPLDRPLFDQIGFTG